MAFGVGVRRVYPDLLAGVIVLRSNAVSREHLCHPSIRSMI